MDNTKTLLTEAAWIWLEGAECLPHQYVCFQKKARLAEIDCDTFADISVDSDFILYINGVEVIRGQFSDYPERKTYTRVRIADFLQTGDNLISVLAYYRGEDFSEYRKGMPGLAFAMQSGDITISSDCTWKAQRHPAFRSGPMPRVTGQMGFTACYDARLDTAWTSLDLGNDWPAASIQAIGIDGFWADITERPVQPLDILPEVPARIVMQGSIRRSEFEGSVASIMSHDYLVSLTPAEVFAMPPAPADYTAHPDTASDYMRLPDDRWLEMTPSSDASDGRFIVLDLGREEVGLLSLCVDAPAGTVLDIAHGEHLDDGRVRMFVGGRNFADRYICRDGINRFILPFRRIGARYIEVHFSCFDRPVKLNYIGLKPTILNVDDIGSFHSNDRLANREYNVAKRTLRLCMHEHYEDCPWREQALYAFDSRNQALYGYYAFGNYDFAAASFDLLGRGIRDDGLLELCAPARIPITIPIFSLVWITEVAEHWLYSGTSVLFDTFSSQIDFMLDMACSRFDASTGLYAAPAGDDIWQFYEWMDGLAGPIGGEAIGSRLDAPYNLFLHESLGSYIWMLNQSGQADKANELIVRQKELGVAIFNAFWNREKNALSTYLLDGTQTHFSDLVQVLALHQEILPGSVIPRVLEGIYSDAFSPMTLSSRLYEILALMASCPSARSFADTRIHTDWGDMLFQGATSFWETARGGDDFDLAGSLCHGWSALPVLYLGAYALGIFPLEPGFGKFAIRPFPGNLYSAKGTVPTPAGPIHMEWIRNDDGLIVKVDGPESLSPHVESLPEAPIAKLLWNGKAMI